MEKTSAVYKITNTITGDFYIGSSKNVNERWRNHKKPSKWKEYPNNPMYLDMKKFGVDKFAFEILAEVEVEQLKETEQKFIEILNPTYNNRRASGWDIERLKESRRKYRQSDKGKESKKKYDNKYDNQLCSFNGETLTLCALSSRFKRKGLSNPTAEAKRYLIRNK